MRITPVLGFYTYQKTRQQTQQKPPEKLRNFSYITPNFTGYYGDNQPVKKLYWITSRNNIPKHDNWTDNHIYEYGYKKWILHISENTTTNAAKTS